MTAALASSELLRANLAAQQTAAQALENLLECERAQIAARDWSALLAVTADKNRAAQRLHALGRELQKLVGDEPPSHRLESSGLGPQWQALLEQARRLQQGNREVHALLESQRERIDAALTLLDRGSGTGLYGRHGRSALTPQRQRLAAV